MVGDGVESDGDVEGAEPSASGLSPGVVNRAGNPSELVAAGVGEGEAVRLSKALVRPKCRVLVSFASILRSCV